MEYYNYKKIQNMQEHVFVKIDLLGLLKMTAEDIFGKVPLRTSFTSFEMKDITRSLLVLITREAWRAKPQTLVQQCWFPPYTTRESQRLVQQYWFPLCTNVSTGILVSTLYNQRVPRR